MNEKLHSLMALIQRLETEPRKYGVDLTLTGTDIHLIEIIGENDNLSVSDAAGLFGVTKGAVSKRLKKLTGEGLVEKRKDPNNLSRTVVLLTSKGKVAYFAHKHWHETMDGGFKDYYDSLGEEKMAIIIEFLTRMEDLCRRLLVVGE